MSDAKKSESDYQGIDAYLTEEERRRLLASLHHALVWVGVKEPEEFKIDRAALKSEMEKLHQTEGDLPPEVHAQAGTVELHHLIWRLINEKELTEQERLQIAELIHLLEMKERSEEDSLREEKLTVAQAKQLYDEAAGVIRSLMDLKDLLKKREHSAETLDRIQRRVSDARRWNDFLDSLKKEKNG